MEIETKEIWVGTEKQIIGIKKFSHKELMENLMKFPLESFVYETKYVQNIVDLCWNENESFRNGINASYGDFLNVYKAILEVNPTLYFENYQMELPSTKKKKENIVEYQPKQEEEISENISLEELVSVIDFKDLEFFINRDVIGQEEAVRQLLGALINTKHRGISKEGCMVDYLLGPSGVGKTSSVKLLADYLGVPLLQIQGSEYGDEVASTKLFGGDPNYIGYDKQGGHLQRFIKKNPNSILLIDEIDKFHQKVISSLTSFFGDGFLTTPSSEEKIPFLGWAYLTSNTGNKLSEANMGKEVGFKFSEGKSDLDIEREKVLKILREQGIGNEFLGRISNFIPFSHLGSSDIEKILNKDVRKLNKELKYYQIILTNSAKKEILKVSDTCSFGAREIYHNLDKLIVSKINYKYEMEKNIPKSSMISVDFEDGKFAYSIAKI